MAKDTVFIGLYFTDEEINAYLDEAGIKTGIMQKELWLRYKKVFKDAWRL